MPPDPTPQDPADAATHPGAAAVQAALDAGDWQTASRWAGAFGLEHMTPAPGPIDQGARTTSTVVASRVERIIQAERDGDWQTAGRLKIEQFVEQLDHL